MSHTCSLIPVDVSNYILARQALISFWVLVWNIYSNLFTDSFFLFSVVAFLLQSLSQLSDCWKQMKLWGTHGRFILDFSFKIFGFLYVLRCDLQGLCPPMTHLNVHLELHFIPEAGREAPGPLPILTYETCGKGGVNHIWALIRESFWRRLSCIEFWLVGQWEEEAGHSRNPRRPTWTRTNIWFCTKDSLCSPTLKPGDDL